MRALPKCMQGTAVCEPALRYGTPATARSCPAPDLISFSFLVQLGETGWPSAGGLGATPQNATDYLSYSVTPLASGQGTPRYPTRPVKAYIFALFDEDLKYTQGIGDYELHWGLLYANGTVSQPWAGPGCMEAMFAPGFEIEMDGIDQ
jgi:hypothetical protein